ncbi:hypothetical protein Rhe02_28860 [Rhizocola hellebori]|uniref:LapA family protein n=1 Tax=Rhizocola hellebori TaxID=1392758 RepID=A0A8J3Q7F2_9ACTN|nr:hypothetical protein [Rhizocola hellebori]GIH04819.1 hypothetical protein Rhe02_28860 [Rhizocola hellebori]
MIILGLLLLLAATGLSLAAIQANRSVFDDSAGVVGLFGYSIEASVGQVFLVGAIAGAVALLGLAMIIGGFGRGARRRIAARRELRRQDAEVRDTQRREEADVAERARAEKTAARAERKAAAEQEREAQHRAAEEREEELARH